MASQPIPKTFMSATPELPSVEPSKAAEMLERVRSEAAELRNFTITFLSLLLYVAIIIASTTHEQILRIDPVKLPLLNVEIPIVGFYWFMPALLFFIHLYILIQHYLFSQLAFRFREELLKTDDKTRHQLQRSLGNLPFLHWLAGRQNRFMTFLMSAITVVSLIVWPLFTFWWLQAAFLPYHDNRIVWTQRIFLLLDVGFVAYIWAKILNDQDDAGQWWRPWLAPFCFSWWSLRIKAFFKGLGQMLTVPERWRRTSFPSWFNRFTEWLEHTPMGTADAQVSKTTEAAITRWVLSSCLTVALFFSFVVSTLPDSPEEAKVVKVLTLIEDWIDPLKHSPVEEIREKNRFRRSVFIVTNWLHEPQRVELSEGQDKEYDPARLRECDDEINNDENGEDTDQKSDTKCYLVDGLFPRNLILNERILVANKDLPPEILSKLDAKIKNTDPEALVKAKGLDLRGRHLEYADFSYSSLPNVDLRRTQLKGASFGAAKLDKARLANVEFYKANLFRAELHEANLTGAQLHGANLTGALLHGAQLNRAQLHGANLTGALLHGAQLNEAQLHGANLTGAQLHGADLSEANLRGTILYDMAFSPVHTYKLRNRPKYHFETERELAFITRYRHYHFRIVDLSMVSESTDCVAADPQVIKSLQCHKMSDPELRKKTCQFWTSLACQDYTEKLWIAKSMIERTEYRIADEILDFAPMLVAKLKKPDQCPGLAKLNEDWKNRLLKAANEAQAKAQKTVQQRNSKKRN